VAHSYRQPPHIRWSKPELANIDDGLWQGALWRSGGNFSAPTGGIERWHIKAGVHKYRVSPQQFADLCNRKAKAQLAQILSPANRGWSALPPGTVLSCGGGEYAALYPSHGSRIARLSFHHADSRTFLSILPNNYKESSYPVAL